MHFARRPESWLYVVAAGATLAVVLPLVADASGAAHVHHHASVGGRETWLRELRHWSLMVLAMMLPVVAPYARRVAIRSLWRRRHRATASFVLGYLAVWLSVGAVLTGVLATLGRPQTWPVVSILLLGAAAWQVSRPRRRVLRRCGALPPEAASGWRADCGAAANGLRYGVRCAFVCGPAMAAAAVSGSLILMGGVLLLFLSERARGPNPDRRVGRPLEAWVLAMYAVVAIA